MAVSFRAERSRAFRSSAPPAGDGTGGGRRKIWGGEKEWQHEEGLWMTLKGFDHNPEFYWEPVS